jgi:hypothetical protein
MPSKLDRLKAYSVEQKGRSAYQEENTTGFGRKELVVCLKVFSHIRLDRHHEGQETPESE